MAEKNSAEDHGSSIVWTHNLTEAETSDAKTEKDDKKNLMVCDDTQANELQFPDFLDGASLEAPSVWKTNVTPYVFETYVCVCEYYIQEVSREWVQCVGNEEAWVGVRDVFNLLTSPIFKESLFGKKKT